MSTPTFTEEGIKRLPQPIVDKLQSLIARIRRVLLIKGLYATAAALIFALLCVMGVDAAFDVAHPVIRWGLSLAAFGFAGAVAWRWLIRPQFKKISLTSIARLIEIRHPEMHERISTAVELLGSKDAESMKGSDQLLGEVVKSALLDAETVSPEVEVTMNPVKQPKWAAIAAVGVLLVLFALWPRHSGLLLARAVAPFLKIGNASSFELRVITQDLTVAEGEPITVLVAAKGRQDRRVDLHTVSPAGATVTERMLKEISSQVEKDETAFALHFPAAKESFTWYVTAGRARTASFSVTVVPRPEIENYQLIYDYPAYTGLPQKVDPDSLGDISAPAGTKVTVKAKLNRKLATGEVVVDGGEEARGIDGAVTFLEENGQPRAQWVTTLLNGQNSHWEMHVKDSTGLANVARAHELRALSDEGPTVVIDSPLEREIQLKPTDTLPVEYSASEDYGFSAVDLRVKLDSRGETRISQTLPERDPSIPMTWHGRAALDLSKLNLDGVRDLRVRVQVSDNLPKDLSGPQIGMSDEIVIHLNRGAESFMEQTVAKQENAVRKELDQLKNQLYEEKNQAEQKMWQLRNKEEMKPEQLDQLEKLQQKTAQTAEALAKLAEKMEKSAFAERAKEIAAAAQDAKPAAEALQKIPQSDSPQERSEAAQEARDDLANAVKKVEDTLNNLWQDTQQAKQAAQLAALAQQQQQLADQAAAAAKPEAKPDAASPQTAQNDPAQAQPQPATPDAQTAQNSQPQPQPNAATPAAQDPAAAAATPQAPQAPTGQPDKPELAAKFDPQQWQQQQQDVAGQIQNMNNQAQGQNPQATADQLKKLASQAQDLAKQADAQADAQEAATKQAAQDSTAAGDAKAAQQEATAAQAARELAEKTKQFDQQAGQQLDQNGLAATAVEQATMQLNDAAKSATEAASQLSAELSQQAESGSPDPAGAQPGQQPQTAQSTPPQQGQQPQSAQGDAAQPAQSGQNADANSAATPADPAIAAAAAAAASAAGDAATPAPTPADGAAPATPASGDAAQAAATPPASAGEAAMQTTGQQLNTAADALNMAAQALTSQAENLTEGTGALAQATQQSQQASQAGQQAQQAGQQAAQQAAQAGQNQQAQQAAAAQASGEALGKNAATPAQQAASNLAMAAAAAQKAAGIPQGGLNSQSMGQHNTPPQPGQGRGQQQNMAKQPGQQPDQPGDAQDQQGLQATQAYTLPPELAKLGLTSDEWARLRGLVQSGAGAEGDRVPTEYRDLVRGYFRALSAGPAAAAPGKN